MKTIIFTNAEKIESKISQSANRASFDKFFNAAENYDVYCEELTEDLTISELVRALTIKKESLEIMQKAIPELISRNESSIIADIRENLDVITAIIDAELSETTAALIAAKEQQRLNPSSEVS